MDGFVDRIVDAWPVALAVSATAFGWWLVSWLTTRKPEQLRELETRRQLLLTAVTVIGIVAVILSLPVELQIRGALLGALGVAMAAVIGLSSTTIVGNALAGLMLRSVRNFRVGDFLSVEGHFGRVTYRRLLATEIQTEDRDLTTLPNLFLVTHPVKVVKASGTIVSATVSLGYDSHHLTLDPLFAEAVERAGLTDPFTYVTELGDHAVTYRVAGFLAEVKHLLTVRSGLRTAIFDVLGAAGVEIVSPTFMNQRQVTDEPPIIATPRVTVTATAPSNEPEQIVFDKAEAAAEFEELRAELDAAKARLSDVEAAIGDAEESDALGLEVEAVHLRSRIAEITSQLEIRAVEPDDD